MRTILADDLPMVRAGIKALLKSMASQSVEIVSETADGKELIDLCLALKPELVITEISLKGLGGLDVQTQLQRHMPNVKVLFLTSRADPYCVRSAVQAGASGYVVKEADPVELQLAIKAVMRGQRYLSPQISAVALERRSRQRTGTEGILSGRQRQVLRLMARGKSTREISELLNLSIKTVETHRARTAQTLGLTGTNALMRFAIKAGMDQGDAG